MILKKAQLKVTFSTKFQVYFYTLQQQSLNINFLINFIVFHHQQNGKASKQFSFDP